MVKRGRLKICSFGFVGSNPTLTFIIIIIISSFNSVGRVPALHAGSLGFDPQSELCFQYARGSEIDTRNLHLIFLYGGLAQMVERSLSILIYGVIAQGQSFRLQSGWSVVQFHLAPYY